jgi:hypothetical protein
MHVQCSEGSVKARQKNTGIAAKARTGGVIVGENPPI